MPEIPPPVPGTPSNAHLAFVTWCDLSGLLGQARAVAGASVDALPALTQPVSRDQLNEVTDLLYATRSLLDLATAHCNKLETLLPPTQGA